MGTQWTEEEISLRKKALRAGMRLKWEALADGAAEASGERITRDVLDSAWYREAKSVFIYISVGKEPDTRALIRAALRDGKEVYVPRCGKKPVMDAVRILSPDGLRPGPFGIPEPAAGGSCAQRVDLALVPCLSVSPKGSRLGHGGGYYDAFLSGHPCRTVCLCHKALMSPDIPAGSLDVPVDAVAYGEGVIPCDRGC